MKELKHHCKKGKNVYIRALAAAHLGKRIDDVTEPQFLAAKALFLALAYDAFPQVVEGFKKKLEAA